MKLHCLTIAEARRKLDSGEISSLELTKDCLAAIKHHNKKINACLAIDERGALAAAKAADARIAQKEKGALLGIPFLAKDNIMTKGIITTAASKMLEKYVAPYDATVISRLKAAGAVLLGKTNLDEFAHGASTEYSAFGATKNPWDTTRVPGGSSGGSAAAVAANFCLFALGTDTGGSVRHPAALCGVVGLKPTYGLCSRFGLIAMTSSTDVPGILAKNSDDAATVLNVISGHDERDATSLYSKPLAHKKAFSLKGIRIGIPKEQAAVKLAPAIKKEYERLIAELKKAGAKIVSVSLPSSDFALAAYYVITPSEISSNLARFDGLRFGLHDAKQKKLGGSYEGVREAGFGPEVKRRIMLGTYCLSAGYYDAYYVRAQKVRSKVIAEYKKAFMRCDILLTPTTPAPAFKLGAQTKNPLKMYLEDYFLVPASLAGLPAVSIPLAKKPLPIGLQLTAPLLEEGTLLAAARALEEFAIDRYTQANL